MNNARPVKGGRRQLPIRPEPILVVGTDAQPECRSAATGEHAEFLHEAAQRLEAVSSLLAAAAVGHVAPSELANSLPPIVAVIDDAARFVHLAGEQ